jgi:hypothetical protein
MRCRCDYKINCDCGEYGSIPILKRRGRRFSEGESYVVYQFATAELKMLPRARRLGTFP